MRLLYICHGPSRLRNLEQTVQDVLFHLLELRAILNRFTSAVCLFGLVPQGLVETVSKASSTFDNLCTTRALGGLTTT